MGVQDYSKLHDKEWCNFIDNISTQISELKSHKLKNWKFWGGIEAFQVALANTTLGINIFLLFSHIPIPIIYNTLSI